MNLKRALTVSAIAVGLLAVAEYGSPYWELQRMRSAIEARDADAISEHVDFPSLRESVKGQMMAMIGNEMAKEEANKNPFASLGQAMAVALINPMIDAAVSPAGVIAMIESGKTGLAKPGNAASSTPGHGEKVDYSVSYRSWDKVAVTKKGAAAGSFIFRRYGIWNWKLSAIEFPPHLTAGNH
ncbi:DUF2939 domain-containing protein [Massilia terrae]|uniref:DUF2939 domain-containing protein n=1 Tax=Massilia terrae TaxID=1811224 RepID=A0ABT2D3A8_9BURK|nr:DUF2939 domain-containing protein [Massilia terrae]MCS0660735.1 DUF2939 domain-containing protein [Massilia terrae]